MNPVIGGALIGAAGNLLGGMFGSKSAARQAESNNALQKEFAQHGVAWKVKDAQEAGVHPLFALGGNTQGYTPNPVIPDDRGIGRAAEGIGNAVAASQTTGQRLMEKAQLNALAAQADRDFAAASLSRSEEARGRQVQASTSPWPELANDQDEYYQRFSRMHGGPDPAQVFNPYSDAIVRRYDPAGEPVGEHLMMPEARGGLGNQKAFPGWSKWDFGDGPVVTFSSQPDQLMESMGELGPVQVEMLIVENTRRYGEAGKRRILRLLGIAGSKEAGKEYGKQWGGYTPFKSPKRGGNSTWSDHGDRQ